MAPGTNQPIRTIGILKNPHIEEAESLAAKMASVLEEYEVETWQSQNFDSAETAQLAAETDLLITLGGDGSILRAARVAAGTKTAIFGVNLGRMGFLTEAEPDNWEQIIPGLLQGDYWIEERMMLHATAKRESTTICSGNALNDVVVGQGQLGRVVRLEVRIDGDLLTYFVADAMIVATPTGSTAYALAAGGPIMPPQLRNILLVPVAPHLSLSQAVVLAEGMQIQIVIHGHSPAALTLDGQTHTELLTGDQVDVEASPLVTRFARVRERDYFYRTLMSRLMPRDKI